jgi:hypothetical protein
MNRGRVDKVKSDQYDPGGLFLQSGPLMRARSPTGSRRRGQVSVML